MSMNVRTPKQSGFTLVETLVAIAILTLSVAGPLYTASRAIVAARTSSDQLTASYLAQEGIEYVRALRDTSYLDRYRANDPTISASAWANFLSSSQTVSVGKCRAPQSCAYDPGYALGSGYDLTQCPSSGCPSLVLYGGMYRPSTSVSGGTPTVFTRSIQAIDVDSTNERIISRVTWSFHGTPYAVTVTDTLTPWQ